MPDQPPSGNLRDAQLRVADFVAAHGLETAVEYRVLDLASEVGELAKDVVESTEYGADPDGATVSEGELGDALFALLATASAADVEADAALEAALEKYERRLDERGRASSGSHDG